jgi:outer membrane protein TolC
MPRRILKIHPRSSLAGLALYALALASPGHAQTLSLAEVVHRAGDQASRLQAQDAAVEAARQDAARSGALPDPMLEVGIENLPVTGADAFDTGAEDMTMKEIGLRQDIPSSAKRQARRLFADKRVEAAQADAIAERLRVQRAAAEAWIELWAVHQQQGVLARMREQAQVAAALAKARVRGGGSPGDALAAESALLDFDSRLEVLRGNEAQAKSRLRRWVPSAVDPILAGEPDFSVLPVNRARMVERIDEMGPLLTARARVESAAAAVDVSRADKRPDWSVRASYGQRDRDRSDMLTLEFGVTLPLFGRNRQDRDVLARQAEYRQALALEEDDRRALAAELDAAFARWESLRRQVELHADRLLPLARDRSAVAMAAYRAGGALQPWLDARSAELEVHQAHAEHLSGLAQAWAALAFLLPESPP